MFHKMKDMPRKCPDALFKVNFEGMCFQRVLNISIVSVALILLGIAFEVFAAASVKYRFP